MALYSAGEYLKLINNKLASEKLKSKKFPAAVYIIPIAIVGIVIYAGIMTVFDDEDSVDDDSIPLTEKSEKAKDPLYKANELQKKLYHFNIAQKVIYPGDQVSGFIAFRSKHTINLLDIEVRDLDYEVVN